MDHVDINIEVSSSQNKNNLEQNEAAQKIVELEALIELKNKKIKELREAEDKLKMETEKSKEQDGKKIKE